MEHQLLLYLQPAEFSIERDIELKGHFGPVLYRGSSVKDFQKSLHKCSPFAVLLIHLLKL